MPIKDLSEAEAGHEGLSFESMLREYLACGVIALDAAGQIAALTPEAERTLRLPAGKPHSLESLPAPVQAVLREVLASGQAAVERRIVLEFDGKGMALSLTALPVGAGKKSARVFALFRDLSSNRKMEHNLRRLDRLASMGTLSASMAHEIKNALVPLRTLVDLLLEQKSGNELADTVRRELARVDSLVSHMLRFAPPAQPAFAPVRLHEILEHSLRLAEHRVGDKIVSFHRQFHAQPDAFNGDDHQLEQAFVNLLFNAVEALGAEGALTVETELVSNGPDSALRENGNAAGLLQVRITDTGAGITPENAQRIFEPFFTTKHHGTGLGLPVTHRIIAEHGGSIQVDSRPGQGTTFTILLPVNARAAAP